MFKNIVSYLPKKALTVVAGVLVSASIIGAAVAGFGPDRPTKAWSADVEGFQYVTFNSFTGVPNIGDERDFLRGVSVGRDGSWIDPVASVEQSTEVEAKIYIHNNADARLNDAAGQPGVAKNVTVKVELPSGSSQAQDIKAIIDADNANEENYFDTLSLTGANAGFFELEYVAGSAKLHNDGVVTALSDSIVTTGVNLGDQKGCFDDVQEVTFRVKVKMPHYTVQKSVRLDGQTSKDWKESVDVTRGQKVDWAIEFKNIGQTQLNNVKIVDEIPPFMTVVPGSVKLINGTYPAGFVYPDTAIQANGKQVNVDIGSYTPNSNAYVVFKTTINDAEEISCGTHKLVNIAYATPNGYGSINDGAEVYVVNDNECENPEEPTYSCKKVEIAKLGGRKIKVDVSTLTSGDAKVKSYEINYGDGSAVLVTDKTSTEYEYAKDGTYKVTAKVNFTVAGDPVNGVTGASCEQVVSFDTPTTPPTKPPVLPNTGAGSVASVFAAVSAMSFVAYQVAVRRMSR